MSKAYSRVYITLLVGVILLVAPLVVSAQENNSEFEDVSAKYSAEASGDLSTAVKHKETIIDKAKEAAKNATIKASIGTDVEILEGLNLGVKAPFQVEPAYVGGYFLRYDSFAPKMKVQPGKWFLKDKSPLFLNLDLSSEIGVWRYFESKSEALRIKDMPPVVDWIVDYLPVNANRILKKMKPGDMVRFRVPLQIATGLNYKHELDPTWSAEAGITQIYLGNFDIYVFRADNNKVRLRIIAKNDNKTQIKGKIGINTRGIDQLILEKGAEALKLDELVFLELIPRDKNHIFLADYTLDFNRQEVRDAYDALFSKALIYKNKDVAKQILKLVYPLSTHGDLKDMLIANLKEIEKIYKEEVNNGDHQSRRVDRNFYGSNDSKGRGRNYRLGTSLLYKLSVDSNYRENKLVEQVYSNEGVVSEQHFLFDTWYRNSTRSALATTYREELFRSANIIYEADKDNTPTNFSSIGFYYDYRDKKYKDYEHRDVIKHFKQILPQEIFQQMKEFLIANNFKDLEETIRNMKVQSRYFINKNGLASVENRFKGKDERAVYEEVYRLVMHVIDSSGLQITSKVAEGKDAGRTNALNISTKNTVAQRITENMVIIINSKNSAAERKNAMSRLAKISIFQRIGPAFFFSLLPDNAIAESVYFEIKFFLKEKVEPLTFISPLDEKGAPKIPANREFLEQVLDIQNILNDSTPDLRLEGDEDSLTERRTSG